MFNLESVEVNFVKPYVVMLEIDGKNMNFQIDTGSGISAMSVNDFNNFKIANLENNKSTDLSLKAYNNTIIIHLGYLLVNVKFKNYKKKLKLYIIKEGGPPIIGRE